MDCYRSSLFKPTIVFQITFLEDVLLVTNWLCLLLQSDKKDFGAISRVVNSTIVILEEIKEDVRSIYLKRFKQSEDIIERVSLIEMRSTVASGTRKQSRIDASITRIEFHSSTINPFVDAVMEKITCVQSVGITCVNSLPSIWSCWSTWKHLIRISRVWYARVRCALRFWWKWIPEKLLRCPYDAMELEFRV